jgi:DNA-directed RNA polymerase specialized sigma24 family protein
MLDEPQSEFLVATLTRCRLALHELLTRAIADLPEHERLVFALYYYEQLETSEVALLLGESSTSVMQMHASELRHVKARIGGEEKQVSDAEFSASPDSRL